MKRFCIFIPFLLKVLLWVDAHAHIEYMEGCKDIFAKVQKSVK